MSAICILFLDVPARNLAITLAVVVVGVRILYGFFADTRFLDWSEFRNMQVPELAPENGANGLRHWKNDLVAGLIVSLVSVPLSLGIAVASGAPPITGLISSIIAGLVFPFLGGSFVTISGPAAGLAPVVYASILALGHGHMESGYKLVLAVICIAGLLQVALSHLKAARLSSMFPASAVEGMLASIGLLIIAKQIPNFIGHPFRAHEFFGVVIEAPQELLRLDPKVFLISIVCLSILMFSSLLKKTRLRFIPPQLIAVIVGIGLAKILNLDSAYLIHLPQNIFSGFTLPDFSGLFHDSSLWWTAIGCVVTLTLVDGCESLATVMAIDKLDPYKRKSNQDKTLFAMGMCNVFSSLAGGLTIIPGGIKSTTCIVSGGRTLWANFYNAVFLLLYALLARDLINYIPLGALAAVLIHIGFKLCAPQRWAKVAKIGPEQLIIFGSTVLVTLSTDLLWGLIFGTAMKFILAAFFSIRNSFDLHHGHQSVDFSWICKEVLRLFKDPVSTQITFNGVYIVRFDGPLVCFNMNHVTNELNRVPHNCHKVQLQFSPAVGVIDHTSACMLLSFKDELELRGQEVALVGLEKMTTSSQVNNCMRHSVHLAKHVH